MAATRPQLKPFAEMVYPPHILVSLSCINSPTIFRPDMRYVRLNDEVVNINKMR